MVHRDSDPQKAIELSQHARAIFKELGDPREEANTIIETARAYTRLKTVPGGDDYRAKALELLEEARPLLDAAGDRRGVANVLMRIGFVHQSPSQDLRKLLDPSERMRNLAKARDAFERARTLFGDTGDGVSEADALTEIGQVSVDSYQYQRAVEAWRDALVLRRAARDTRNEADLLSKLGGAYEVLDQNAESLTSYQQEQQLRRSLNDEPAWARARAAEGRLQVRLRDADEALILLGETLAVFQKTKLRDDEAATHRYRGLAYLLLKQETNAVEAFNQEFQLLRDSNRKYLVQGQGDRRPAGYRRS